MQTSFRALRLGPLLHASMPPVGAVLAASTSRPAIRPRRDRGAWIHIRRSWIGLFCFLGSSLEYITFVRRPVSLFFFSASHTVFDTSLFDFPLPPYSTFLNREESIDFILNHTRKETIHLTSCWSGITAIKGCLPNLSIDIQQSTLSTSLTNDQNNTPFFLPTRLNLLPKENIVLLFCSWPVCV